MVENLIKSLWKGTQNIVGWVGLFIACYSVYSQTLGKEHELTVVVSSLGVHKDELVVGVLFNNSGDFVETVIDGGISLPTSDVSSDGYNLQDCFEPVTIKAKDAVHKYYRVDLKLYGEHQSETDLVTRPLLIDYDIVMPNGSISNQIKELGSISHRISDGLIARFKGKASSLNVHFNNEGFNDFGDHYIPESYDHSSARFSDCNAQGF